MFELIIAAAILIVLMGGLLSIFSAINGEQSAANNMPQAQYGAEQMVLTIAKAVRGASLATASDTGFLLNSAVDGGSSSTAASSTSLATYSGSTGALVRTLYSNSSGNVTQKIGAAAATTMYSGASVTFGYYYPTTTYPAYHSSALGASSNALSVVNAPFLVAVQITGTVTVSGRSSTYSTVVRLRNGPLRSNVSD